jgi:hypothetical protein
LDWDYVVARVRMKEDPLVVVEVGKIGRRHPQGCCSYPLDEN